MLGLFQTSEASPPSAGAVQIDHGSGASVIIDSGQALPPRTRTKAIRAPSGDHLGDPARAVVGAR